MTWTFWKREPNDQRVTTEKLPAEGICEPYYQLGENVETRSSLIVQQRTHFAVCENGMVTWAGNNMEFSALIREAARRANFSSGTGIPGLRGGVDAK
jgi:hypothetical protein